jgi:hypothetical protein
MTNEKPIIFSTGMVRAILDGRKTVTRRVIKPKYSNTVFEMFTNKYGTRLVEIEEETPPIKNANGTTTHKVRAAVEVEPKYSAGDILYVREAYCPRYFDDGSPAYRADYNEKRLSDVVPEPKWRPSIHMPRSAARLFLRMTGVRAERLQDITEEDAIAEGVRIGIGGAPYFSCVNAFRALWGSLYAKSGHGWDTNPWVWAYTFERTEAAK